MPVFDIEINVKPFAYCGEVWNTHVSLNFIVMPLADWENELPFSEHSFPKNPESGYVDGSMYFSGAHNPVDLTRLKFGKISALSIEAEMDLGFDFAFEGPEELGAFETTWTLPINYDSSLFKKVYSTPGLWGE